MPQSRPFHGLKYILEAAKRLKNTNIKFEILGEGQNYQSYLDFVSKNNLKNVNMRGWVNANLIPKYIAKSNIVLGIFGNTPKAKRVIPNKAVHTLAMAKPLITGDSPAARELFIDGKNVMLAKMANPQSIAEKIMILYNDKNLRINIAKEGYKLFRKKLSSKQIGKELTKLIQSL